MRASVIVLLLLGLPALSLAADGQSATVGGNVSAVNMESRTDVSFSGSFGIRFTRVVGVEIDATWVPSVRSDFPDIPIILGGSTTPPVPGLTIFPGPTFFNGEGRILIFSNNVRIEMPTTSKRLTPYFVAGGGIASVRQSVDFGFSVPAIASQVPPTLIRPFTERIESTSTELALTLGGGVGIQVASHLFVDADLRLFRLIGDEDRNLGRFGVGVRYTF